MINSTGTIVVLNIANCLDSLDYNHLGNALKSNPGYLKLRRIRAAQSVSNTVRLASCKAVIKTFNIVTSCCIIWT